MGPLAGVKIVELAGIGPGPLAAMLLADLGATVLRVDRKTRSGLGLERPLKCDLFLRNRLSIRVDLKDREGVELVQRLVEEADALIEGFRPGVTERLGLGPEDCLRRNARLVYGRATGWGQDGPLAQSAGHDVNYIAITGVLNAIGRPGQPPSIPLNVIGDYAAGSLYLALGIVAGVLEARSSGKGQVVEAAIVDGVVSMMSVLIGLRQAGVLGAQRCDNLIDGGAPFYEVYECADGKFVCIGAIEPKFFRELLRLLDVDIAEVGEQMDRKCWPQAKQLLAAKFKTRTRAEWTALLEGTDACFAPVLDLEEAHEHPHLKARGTFVDVDGIRHPAPNPRFSRTPGVPPSTPNELSTENAVTALRDWLPGDEIDRYRAAATFT